PHAPRFTASLFFTALMPCTLRATCSACARCCAVRTLPVSVTTPFAVSGLISCAPIPERLEISAALTRLFRITSGVWERVLACGTSYCRWVLADDGGGIGGMC